MQYLIAFARLTVVEVPLGKHPAIHQDWLKDDKKTIIAITAQCPGSVNLQCIELMGNAYPSIVGRGTSVADVLFQGGY
ncbi:hypothetical protein M3J09_010541 [Ascochyta lentis]